MLPVAYLPLFRRLGASVAVRQAAAIALTAGLHLVAIVIMLWSETDFWSKAAFIFTWGLLNFAWLLVLRRPSLAAGLSLVMVTILILLSRFKFEALFMTANFVDLMILDEDTISFLLMVTPGLQLSVAIFSLCALAFLVVAWRLDHYRVGLRAASVGCVACLAALTGLSFAVPTDIDDKWLDENYVSKFARSASVALTDYFTRGIIKSDATVTERLRMTADETCRPLRRAPHIVMILDEFELRPAHGARRESSRRLRPALSLARRQDADVPGRRRRRSDLVHGVQRVDRSLVPLVRALRRTRLRVSLPVASSADYRTRSPAAAIAPTACIRGTGIFSAPATFKQARASRIFSTRSTCARSIANRTASITMPRAA